MRDGILGHHTGRGAHAPVPPQPLVSCPRCGNLHAVRDASAHPAPVCEDCARGAAKQLPSSRFHALSDLAIAREVQRTAPGTYALGYLDGTDFVVFYVGRSDSDVGSRLLEWVGAPSSPRAQWLPARLPWQSRSGPQRTAGRRASRRDIGAELDTGYTHFAFDYARSPIEAFEHECRVYHGLGGPHGLDNRGHPESPAGIPWPCPVRGF